MGCRLRHKYVRLISVAVAMKVVALVSGGKDSCFNLMLCEKFGHELVALANLRPVDADHIQEIDSYMYQTVGHNLVGAYAACTGLPLFRKKVYGSSKNLEKSYQETKGDEVEDLRALLRSVKRAMPEVGAVSCGAIRSDYQRVRVESVCESLGLVCLSYMWRQHQDKLLTSMIEQGVHAVLIKVACLGLHPNKDLGKTIAQMQPKLRRLAEMYGVHICGEGGEYETLTLDCPLFKHGRIVIDESHCELDDSGENGNLVVDRFHIERKDEEQQRPFGDDPSSSSQIIDVDEEMNEGNRSPIIQDIQVKDSSAGREEEKFISNDECLKCVAEAELVESTSHKIVSGSLKRRAEEEMSDKDLAVSFNKLMLLIEGKVTEVGRTLKNSIIVYFYLGDMAQFASLNQIYKSHFGTVNPPSRCCIEMGLGKSEVLRIQVVLSGRAELDDSRSIMHVQSISQWAPSCIGPYSQAAQFGECLFISGQIGLEPPLMQFTVSNLEEELEATLCHAESVSRAVNASLRRDLVKLVCFLSADKVKDGRAAYQGISEQVHRFIFKRGAGHEEGENEDENEDFGESNYKEPEGLSYTKHTPLVILIEVPRLPKDARVELHPVLHLPSHSTEDGEIDEGEDLIGEEEEGVMKAVGKKSHWLQAIYTTDDLEMASIDSLLQKYDLERKHVFQLNVYCTEGEDVSFGGPDLDFPVQVFNVSGMHTLHGEARDTPSIMVELMASL